MAQSPVKETLKSFHNTLLDHIYEHLPKILFQCSLIPNDVCCPIVAGGYAFQRMMGDRCPDYLKTDDIDIKFVIKPTIAELNTLPHVAGLIQISRYLVLNLIWYIADLFLKQNLGAFEYKIQYRHPYRNDDEVLKNFFDSLRPVDLLALNITYKHGLETHQFGLVDTSMFVREDMKEIPSKLTIKEYYAGLKMQQQRPPQQRDEPVPQPETACTVIPRMPPPHTLLPSPEYILLDTIKMMSKLETAYDVCIKEKSVKRDVYKAWKYILKFLQLCAHTNIVPLQECEAKHNEVITILQQHTSYADLLTKTKNIYEQLHQHPKFGRIIDTCLSYIPEVTQGSMIAGGKPTPYNMCIEKDYLYFGYQEMSVDVTKERDDELRTTSQAMKHQLLQNHH